MTQTLDNSLMAKKSSFDPLIKKHLITILNINNNPVDKFLKTQISLSDFSICSHIGKAISKCDYDKWAIIYHPSSSQNFHLNDENSYKPEKQGEVHITYQEKCIKVEIMQSNEKYQMSLPYELLKED